MGKNATSDSTLISAFNYWIVKGKPSLNDFDRMLKPGRVGHWRTKKLPRFIEPGDRLFFWRGSPALEVVGLGEFIGVEIERRKDDGETIFQVKYLTPTFSRPIGRDQLKRDVVFEDASFLKSGPAGTVFPLTRNQGMQLYAFAANQNPQVRPTWPDANKDA